MRSIRTRILALFLMSVAAFAASMIYAILQLQTIGAGLEAIHTGYLPLARATADLEAVIRQMDRDHDRFARETPLPGMRTYAEIYSTSINEGSLAIRDIAVAAQETLPDPRDTLALQDMVKILDQIDAGQQAYDQAFSRWLEGRGSETEDLGRTQSELNSTRTELILQIGRLNAQVEERANQVSERMSRAQNRAYQISGALAGLAVIFAGVLALVALFMLRPMVRLTQQAQRLGAGDYTRPIEVGADRAGAEVEVLAREFNSMAAAVAERDRRLSERAAALDRLSLRLRQVLDTIQAGLVVIKSKTTEMVNPAAEVMWSVSPNAPAPDILCSLQPGRHESLSIGQRLFDVVVVPFGEGGHLVVGEDVTQRIADRERLVRTERLALVGQMLAQITHEVRNPLNAMSLNAELLAEEFSDPEAKEIIGIVIGEIRRLENLTTRYLHLSRKRNPEITTEDPVAMTQQVIRLEEEVLRRAGVQVDVSGDDGEFVDLDGDALRRALHNVIRNGVEAGATHLDIGITTTHTHVTITIADNGPGMDPQQMAQAFDPFYTTKTRGTGLGLAISRQELEEVGGSLICTSNPGQGSTFSLCTPRSEPGDLGN